MASHGSDNLQLGDSGQRLMKLAFGLGLVGVLLSIAVFFVSSVTPARFFRSYLVAFMVVTGISLASLIFTMIWHATRAGWVIALRRLFEVLASNLIWLWVLFIPIAAAMLLGSKTHLYEWSVPDIMSHDSLLQGKAAFLNPGFWLARAAVIFGIWAFLSWFYFRNSVNQDANGALEYTHRMQRLAPVGIILFALTISLAAIDWVMSLEAHWFSTIFGVYTFAASCAAGISFLILTVFCLQRAGKLKNTITDEHYQDLGKLLFAFGVVFWAYIGFSQFMLIWYANIPEETTWFLIRSNIGWWGVSLALVFGHFIIPFLGLISRHVKRRPQWIAIGAVWMLVMAFVDFYWLIVPQVPADLLALMQDDHAFGREQFMTMLNEAPLSPMAAEHLGVDVEKGVTYAQAYGFRPNLADISWLIGLMGIYVGVTIRRMGRQSLVPVHDPRLQESLAFENM